MKKSMAWMGLVLSVSLLAACAGAGGGAASTPTPPVTPTPTTAPTEPAGSKFELVRCRIVDGAETGELLLAGTDSSQVYRLDVTNLAVAMDGGSSSADQLQDGMLVEIGYNGMILETFPAQFSGAVSVGANTEGMEDLCGLYLQVLEDLWEVDPGLNQGITQLGVDLSELTGLTEGEKSALAWRFGEIHGLTPIMGTWQELVDQGYINGKDLYWEDGCLFSISGDATDFKAQKWASGTGAYFFNDCTATEKDGVWTYTIGTESIS